MTKLCYKVVRPSADNEFLSLTPNWADAGYYMLRYSVGKTTYPVIGKLFVFNSEGNAKRFASSQNWFFLYDKLVVLQCEFGFSPVGAKLVPYQPSEFAEFWENMKAPHLTQPVPMGTVFANWVKPVGVV